MSKNSSLDEASVERYTILKRPASTRAPHSLLPRRLRVKLWINSLKHRCVLEHVWNNHHANFTPANVHVLHSTLLTVPSDVRNVRHLTIPVIFRLHQLPAVRLPSLQLNLHRAKSHASVSTRRKTSRARRAKRFKPTTNPKPHSIAFPRARTVTTCPSDSCNNLTGIPTPLPSPFDMSGEI